MKRFVICAVLTVCIVAGSIVLSGCDSDGDGTLAPEELLLGFWLLNSVRMVGPADIEIIGPVVAGDVFDPNLIAWIFSLHLRPDNTYTISQTMFGEPTTVEDGTWSATGSNLTFVLGTETDVYPYALSGDQLTLHLATSTDTSFPADLIMQR